MSPDPPRTHDDYLRTYLASIDTPCPCCGYNLRGLTSSHCPECHQELVLCVGLTERVDREWLIGLVGLATGAGFFGLATVFIVVMSMYFGDWPPFRVVWPIYASGVVMPVLVKVWLTRRRSMRLQPQGMRWRMGLGCWALTVIALLACIIWGVRH